MASIAELAHREKLCTQSLTQSPSLFDAMETEAFASEQTQWLMNTTKNNTQLCKHDLLTG